MLFALQSVFSTQKNMQIDNFFKGDVDLEGEGRERGTLSKYNFCRGRTTMWCFECGRNGIVNIIVGVH